MEKAWAQEAGIGWIGKHTNVVSTSFGSWLLLGEILTTVPFDPDEPATDLCGSCSLCIQACPTGAIVEPYQLDAERCISYLTIEHRGNLKTFPLNYEKKWVIEFLDVMTASTFVHSTSMPSRPLNQVSTLILDTPSPIAQVSLTDPRRISLHDERQPCASTKIRGLST